jgi:hypothetical protein
VNVPSLQSRFVDYFKDLASFINSAIVMKRHNLLITVVRPFLLYGSFQLSYCFLIDFSCYFRAFLMSSISKIPSISQNTVAISLLDSAFLPFLAMKIPCGRVCMNDTPTFHHLLQFSKKVLPYVLVTYKRFIQQPESNIGQYFQKLVKDNYMPSTVNCGLSDFLNK